jgi:carbon-monoxide dehydrogenase medium subunit
MTTGRAHQTGIDFASLSPSIDFMTGPTPTQPALDRNRRAAYHDGMTATASGWVSPTHRAIAPFALMRPATVAEAVAAHGPDAVYFAGGIDQVQWMQDGARPGRVIDLGGVTGLDWVEETADALVLGAGVSHHRMETDAAIARAAPALALTWATVGNIRVRMAGTIGGNVMARHPNYDGPVLLAACGARLHFATQGGGTHETDAAGWSAPDGALMTRTAVPLAAARRIAFDRSLKPVISVAAAIGDDGARVAVGCAFAAPYCAEIDASGNLARHAGDVAAAFAAGMPEPVDDAFASAGYRRRMAEVLLRRLLIRLAEDGA